MTRLPRSTAWCRVGLVVLVIVTLDQVTKAFARSAVDRGDSDPILPGVDLVNVRNDGIAFGMFEDGGAVLAVLTSLALAVLLVYFALHSHRAWVWLPTGLLLGGAVGNLVDRARDGAVTDFIDLPLWPAFNVADIAITGGVLALLLVLEMSAREKDDAGDGRVAA